MPTFNIIGDIHGRDAWKQLVDENCINIFVGDYFDPYEYFPIETMERNFQEINEYKQEHKGKVVLLYGNHDMCYLPHVFERTNRYDIANAKRIQQLFETTKELFYGVAYAIGDDYLVSHAGVTCQWKKKYLSDVEDIRPTHMAQAINNLWERDKHPFTFAPNDNGFDYRGDDPLHSPLWVRPNSLCLNNLYNGTHVKQIVGHSKVKEIAEIVGSVIMVDCLDTVAQSYRLEHP